MASAPCHRPAGLQVRKMAFSSELQSESGLHFDCDLGLHILMTEGFWLKTPPLALVGAIVGVFQNVSMHLPNARRKETASSNYSETLNSRSSTRQPFETLNLNSRSLTRQPCEKGEAGPARLGREGGTSRSHALQLCNTHRPVGRCGWGHGIRGCHAWAPGRHHRPCQ